MQTRERRHGVGSGNRALNEIEKAVSNFPCVLEASPGFFMGATSLRLSTQLARPLFVMFLALILLVSI